MDTETLAQFLRDANKATYANASAKKTASTRLESEDYHFEQGDLMYHDTYFGGRDFIGGEVVYEAQKPKWGMNYYGFVLEDALPEKEVYDFLRKALMKDVTGILPVRGPKQFSENGWMYTLSLDGDLSRFFGQEEISRSGTVVYRCFLHGGFIR